MDSYIIRLDEDEVFVYGCNDRGIHGAGAAKQALRSFGAERGRVGFAGQSYGIITRAVIGSRPLRLITVTLAKITEELIKFRAFAVEHSEKKFFVTKIGTGLAGYDEEDIGDLFRRISWPDNVVLPEAFSQR